MSVMGISQQSRLFNVLGLRDSLRYTARQLRMGSKPMEEAGQYSCSCVCLLDSWGSTIARLFAVQEQRQNPFLQFRSTARVWTTGSMGLSRKSPDGLHSGQSLDRNPFECEPPGSLVSIALTDSQP